jgi:hypothetical protein
MLPLLPFAAGLVTGAVAIRLLRNRKTREVLDNAKDNLRQATVGGLARLESGSAAMRERLSEPAAAPETVVDTVAVSAPPARKPRARKPAAGKAETAKETGA